MLSYIRRLERDFSAEVTPCEVAFMCFGASVHYPSAPYDGAPPHLNGEGKMCALDSRKDGEEKMGERDGLETGAIQATSPDPAPSSDASAGAAVSCWRKP